VSGLDIDAEKTIVCNKLDELREQGATERDVKIAMKNLGISRFVTTLHALAYCHIDHFQKLYSVINYISNIFMSAREKSHFSFLLVVFFYNKTQRVQKKKKKKTYRVNQVLTFPINSKWTQTVHGTGK